MVTTEKGFTLSEVLVAVVASSLGLLGLARMHIAAIQVNTIASRLTQGTTLAQDRTERLMAVSYDDAMLADTTGQGRFTSYTNPNPPQGYTIRWAVDTDVPSTGIKTINIFVTWKNVKASKTFSPFCAEIKNLIAYGSTRRGPMRSRALLSHNEAGVVLVLCLITLVVLTLIGVSTTTTSRLEVEISGNDKTYKEAFYATEMALTAGETVLYSLLSRLDLKEDITPGHYTKGPSLRTEGRSCGITLIRLWSPLSPTVSSQVSAPPRYILEEWAFRRDSLMAGDPPDHRCLSVYGEGAWYWDQQGRRSALREYLCQAL